MTVSQQIILVSRLQIHGHAPSFLAATDHNGGNDVGGQLRDWTYLAGSICRVHSELCGGRHRWSRRASHLGLTQAYWPVVKMRILFGSDVCFAPTAIGPCRAAYGGAT